MKKKEGLPLQQNRIIKHFLLLILLLPLVIFAATSSPLKELSEEDLPVVAAYYENKSHHRPATQNRPTFSPTMIDPEIITDLYYAFAGFGVITKSIDPSNPHITGDFTIQPLDADDQKLLYPEIMALKQRSKKLRILLSIGGWSFNDPTDPEGMGQLTHQLFSRMISSLQSRRQFIDSAIAYAHKFGFDGVDIDWEYPGDTTRGGNPDDFSHFLLFLKECSIAFKTANPPLLLSYAAPAAIPAGVPSKYLQDPASFYSWLADCAKYLDRINVMCYDYHTPFNFPKMTGVNAPLKRDTLPTSYLYIKNTLKNYLDNGVPENKLVLGMPTFGHTYVGVSGLSSSDPGAGKPFNKPGAPGPSTRSLGLLAYYEIADLITQKRLNFGVDQTTDTVYGYHLQNQEWVSFDTPETIKLKAEIAKKMRLKGVFFWAIDMDEYYWKPTYPNIRSAWNIYYEKEGN